MLIQYIVENFMSIGKEMVFSMASDEVNDLYHTRYLKTNKTSKTSKHILRCAAFFGANASGKTNIIKSIEFAKTLVVEGVKSGQKISVNQFKLLDSNEATFSKFQFVIYAGGNIFDYGFQLNKEMVSEEWLYNINDDTEKPLFIRKTDIIKGKTEIQIYSALASNPKLKARLELLKENIGINQKNQLFITKLYENNVNKVVPIVDWFKNLQIIYPGSKYSLLEIKASKDQSFNTFLSELLDAFDTGVKGIYLDKKVLDIDESLNEIPIEAKDDILTAINKMTDKSVITFETKNKRYIITRNNKELNLIKLLTQHESIGGKKVHFETFEESDGTQRLFDLIPALFDTISNDKVYIIDEIDRSLHTLLSKNIIDYFINKAGNDVRSQLLFTTHDVNLLDLTLLRKDEIWFVEKNKCFLQVKIPHFCKYFSPGIDGEFLCKPQQKLL